MPRQEINIMIGGEAGQGLVTLGQSLAKVLVRSGYRIVVTQDYMSRVRGGNNIFLIRAATHEITAGREGVDLLVALDQETLDLYEPHLAPGALVVSGLGLTCGQAACFHVPYKELSQPRYYNTVGLGAAGALLGLKPEVMEATLLKALKKLSAEIKEENRRVLDAAYTWALGQERAFDGLAHAAVDDKRLMLNGNEALGLGALAGGVKFLSFYPMTPSTSVALTVIAHAEAMGVFHEQAEDEIAAINMALGASFAGAPALVCTSGGGFALMGEGVSLAGMTETPVVIVVAQRPGPATGLPTRTEQGDLELVLHAGHGAFPRAILTPGSVEDCFAAAYRAFHLAEASQGPVFVLTDQYLADSYRAVEPFDLTGLAPVTAGARDLGLGEDYRRYEMSQHCLSPRALPGFGPELVVADSDEHDEEGHIIEDAATRRAMQEKRLSKFAYLVGEALPPAFEGPEDPELLLVCWGSSLGPVAEAAVILRGQGRSVAFCHFPQVWPLLPEAFLPRFNRAGRVVMVEANAQGQLARLIRRETGLAMAGLISRYDGRPFTPDYILAHLAVQEAEE
ncbi:MAG: 2-oxoacid:acceptor oxidoreductase subunit alpha [Deltaproteobacteria bacterium]|nr:2-oxoacid:acceptor oxidoreductase subunit alpha [Deltaproteobacteria bacterium]